MRTFISKLTAALAAAAVALGGAGCTDLSESPYTEITEANFNPTARDVASLIGTAYIPLRAAYMGWYGLVDYQGETSDELITPPRPNGWYDGGTYQRLHEHRWDPNQGQPNGLWGNAFAGINSVNRVLYQIETGVIPAEGTAETELVAEMRAMRAYYYWLLLDNFGSVPIVTDFTAVELPTQSTRQQVYDFVVKELTETIPQLSTVTTTAMYGRMNQFGAKGLLARVYLNAGVYTGTPAWDKVLTVTQELVAANKFQLGPTFRSTFSRTNNTSAEIMFAVPYDQVNAAQSTFHMKTLKPDITFVYNMQAGPWGGSAANPQFVDSFDKDDARYRETFMMGSVRDAQGRGYDFKQYLPPITQQAAYDQGYPIQKYEIYQGMTGASDVDYPAVRYAEVLMTRAEALLRTGRADEAAALVTQVRQRNFTGAAAAKATVTGADLQRGSAYNYGWYDADGVVKTARGGTPVTNGGADVQYGRLFDELGYEFAYEAHRRTDMIRFGVFTTKTWFNHTPNGAFRTVFALPLSSLQTNPNLKQNTGY